MAKYNLISATKTLVVAAALAVTTGCRTDHSIVVADFGQLYWHRDSACYLVYENGDSTDKRSIDILLRYSPRLVKSNKIALVIEIQSPDSEVYRDTLNCSLQYKSHSAFETRQIRYEDHLYRFIDNAVLNKTGKYIVKINHFENEYTEGISAVGVSIN